MERNMSGQIYTLRLKLSDFINSPLEELVVEKINEANVHHSFKLQLWYNDEDLTPKDLKSFLEKYGYFELFGPTGHFLTNKMSLYVIFFDTENFYTWHNHEAEELYFVLSGSAKFESKADESEILTPLKFFDGDKNHRIDYGPKFHANAFIFVAK